MNFMLDGEREEFKVDKISIKQKHRKPIGRKNIIKIVKKYYLVHKWFGGENKECLILKGDSWFTGYPNTKSLKRVNPYRQEAEYTEEEIEKIKKKYNTDLEDFEMVEARTFRGIQPVSKRR